MLVYWFHTVLWASYVDILFYSAPWASHVGILVLYVPVMIPRGYIGTLPAQHAILAWYDLWAWLVKWILSMPSVRKAVGSIPPLATTQGPWASPSPPIACMTDVAPCGCLAAKFDSCNSLLSSVHTLLVNILRCVRLYIKRKYYYYYYGN